VKLICTISINHLGFIFLAAAVVGTVLTAGWLYFGYDYLSDFFGKGPKSGPDIFIPKTNPGPGPAPLISPFEINIKEFLI
jgi:hypothetical protein